MAELLAEGVRHFIEIGLATDRTHSAGRVSVVTSGAHQIGVSVADIEPVEDIAAEDRAQSRPALHGVVNETARSGGITVWLSRRERLTLAGSGAADRHTDAKQRRFARNGHAESLMRRRVQRCEC